MENNDTPELTGRQRGIINAIAANRRNKEERLAQELRERGWGIISPYPDAPICIETLGMAYDLMQRAYVEPRAQAPQGEAA